MLVRKKIDLYPITVILIISTIDFLVFFFSHHWLLTLSWATISIYIKGFTCSLNHHHQHYFYYIGDLLASGLNDAERFTGAYLSPVTEGAVYNISNGWYNTGDAKPLGGFEISIVGNISPFKNKSDKKSFLFRESDYENLQIVGGSEQRTDEVLVSSGLGDIQCVRVFIED